MLFLPKLTNFFRDFFLAELGGYPSLPFCGNCGKQVVDLGVPSHHRHLWKKSAKYVVFDLLPKGGSKEMEKKLRHLRQKATCRVTSGKNVLPCSPWVSAGWTWLEIVKSPGAVVQLHIFLIDVVYQFCCFFSKLLLSWSFYLCGRGPGTFRSQNVKSRHHQNCPGSRVWWELCYKQERECSPRKDRAPRLRKEAESAKRW